MNTENRIELKCEKNEYLELVKSFERILLSEEKYDFSWSNDRTAQFVIEESVENLNVNIEFIHDDIVSLNCVMYDTELDRLEILNYLTNMEKEFRFLNWSFSPEWFSEFYIYLSYHMVAHVHGDVRRTAEDIYEMYLLFKNEVEEFLQICINCKMESVNED